ncbi:Phage tail fibre repeat-containing protein [Kosakonia radicincitans]|nr:phage tail protein [Kosakonia radicincitans]SET69643.1 Phage tail fibre repeat-containing protein [Kosakonia radicincitans]
MATKFKTVVTTAGVAKFAAALTTGGKKVNITTMAVGDGGGTLPEPNAGQTKLVNEVWRQALNKISLDNKNKNYVVAELVIPPETGGFWLREMGLYDDSGTLVAVGNMAESYKPKLEEGSGRAQTLRMVIILSDVASVELAIDSTTVMASQDYVDDKILEHEQSRRHPDATLTDKGFTQLSSAINNAAENLAATPKAVKVAFDLATAANDNANARVPSGRTINGHALNEDVQLSAQDIRAIAQDGCQIAGFNSGNAALPYMRHSASNTVIQLATETWTTSQFQPKGSYTPAGEAYTRAESDGRYPMKTNTVIGVRVSARGSIGTDSSGNADIDAPVGNFITGRASNNGDARYSVWYVRALQININGVWRTISA